MSTAEPGCACATGAPYGSQRTSAARRAVAEAAISFARAFTVDELAAAARDTHPGLGAATVYRAVGALRESGALEQVGVRDGAALYTHCHADGHHHHVVCTGCGVTAALPCPAATTDAAAAAGFTVIGHELRVWGLCPRCASVSEAGS
jgi:Fur family ferric uptake transcriptional regulator